MPAGTADLQSYNSGITTPTATVIAAWSLAQNVMAAHNLLFRWHFEHKQQQNMPWWMAMWNLIYDQFVQWFGLLQQDLEDLSELPSLESRNMVATSWAHDKCLFCVIHVSF
jgi:hypothetical protein